MTNDELDALGERVTQFGCMELPGQPRMMHMGTSYLVHDLWRAVRELRERERKLLAVVRAADAMRLVMPTWVAECANFDAARAQLEQQP